MLTLLVYFSLPIKIDSFTAKQPIQYNWAWDVNDLDKPISIPYERYSFHRYVHAQTSQSSFYLARGSNTPIELISFHRYEGIINWRIQLEKRWMPDQAFLLYKNSVLLNLQGETKIVDATSGTFLMENTLDNHSEYAIFYDQEWILYIDPGKRIRGWNRQNRAYIWDYSLIDCETYRLIGMSKGGYLIECIRSNTLFLICIQMDTGKESCLKKWDSTPLRLDTVIQGSTICVASLQNSGSIFLETLTESPPNTIEFSVWKSNELTMPKNRLSTEDAFTGLRLFIHEKGIIIATFVQKQPAGIDLKIIAVDQNLKKTWEKEIPSEIQVSSVLKNAFIDQTMLLFQYPTRNKYSNRIQLCYWLDLQTGDRIQTFYEDMEYFGGALSGGPLMLSNVFLVTASPESNYLTYIVGYADFENTIFRDETKFLQCNKTELISVWKKEYSQDSYCSTSSIFVYKDRICFFASYWDTEEKSRVNRLIQFDPITEKELPYLDMKSFDGYNEYCHILKGDFLTTSTYARNGEKEYLVCYDLSTGKVKWKRPRNVLKQLGEMILTVTITKTSYAVSLYHYLELNPRWTFRFPSTEVSFIGINKANQAFFVRESTVVSILNLEDGTLADEVLLSYPYGCGIHLMNQYLLLNTQYQTIACYRLSTKEILWEKNLGDYSNCFVEEGLFDQIWKGILISDEVMISTYEGNVIYFDIVKGEPLYQIHLDDVPIRQYEIVNQDIIRFFFQDSEPCQRFVDFSIQNPNQSSEMIFPALSNDRQYIWLDKTFEIQGQTFYCRISYSDLLEISKKPVESILKQHQLDPVRVKPECTNFLYIDPYLIFQTTIGEEVSNFYLVAYDLGKGEIIPIQKGVHERYFIHKGLLYIEQWGLYYNCPIGNFTALQPCVYYPDQPITTASGGGYELSDQKVSMPASLQSLDWYYVNQLVKGHFTNEEEEEWLFITGDESRCCIGIMEKDPDEGIFIPNYVGENDFTKKASTKKNEFRFWQSTLCDLDQDNLDEIFILRYDSFNYKALVYVWDYVEDKASFQYQSITVLKDVYEPEMILHQDSLVVQCPAFDEDYNRIMKCEEIVFSPSADTRFISLKRTEVLPSQLLSHQYGKPLANFQFLERPIDPEETWIETPTTSKAYPLVEMPSMLFPPPNHSEKQEDQYMQDRNQYLEKFICLLDQKKDPFKDVRIETYSFDSSRSYTISLQTKEVDWDTEEIVIVSIPAFLLIRDQQKDYIVVKAIDSWDGRHIILFSDQFQFLDVFSTNGNGAEFDAECIVSLQHPESFWINSYMWRGPCRLLCCSVSEESIAGAMVFGYPFLVKKGEETFFEVVDGFHYVDNMGRGSYMEGYQYVDPWSGELCSQLFLKEMKEQLDSLYIYYFHYRSFCATPGKVPYGEYVATFLDGRKKPIYISDSVYIIQYFESWFYLYDSDYIFSNFASIFQTRRIFANHF